MSEYLALATLAASAISAGASYFGARGANSANANLNRANMEFANNQANQAEWFSREMAARQEAFQRESSATAMNFAERMSGTSYQRGMADMRAAGLNPMLAFSQGGATAPQGTSASGATGSRPMASVSPHRMENELGGMVGSAVQAATAVQGLQTMQAQRENILADTALKSQQTQASQANTALQTAQAITEGVRPELIRAQTRTEQGRPALVGAQAAQAGASAANIHAQTETERERPGLVRAQAHQAMDTADYTRTQNEQRRAYGPPGPVSSTVGGVSQVIDSIWHSIRETLR